MSARRWASALTLGVLAAAAVSGTATAQVPDAINWGPAATLRHANGVELQDAAFSGRNVAVSWQEPGSAGPRVRIRTSVQSGSAFGPVATFTTARQSAVDIRGGSELHAVYARRYASTNWVIEHAVGSVDTSGFSVGAVSSTTGVARFPDIACTRSRVFVTWFQKEGANDRLQVAHASKSDLVFSGPVDMGLDQGSFFGRSHSLAVAGVADDAYVAFTRSDGKLRFKRWSVGSGPGFAVTPHATKVIGAGTPGNSAGDTVIAAAGDKVAVAWFKCGGIYACVSNDRGQHWGSPRKVLSHQACTGDFGADQRSIAIHGDRIVITYRAFAIKSPGWVGLISTTNNFVTDTDETIAPVGQDEHLVGFVKVAGTSRLAAAFDPANSVRFRRQQ